MSGLYHARDTDTAKLLDLGGALDFLDGDHDLLEPLLPALLAMLDRAAGALPGLVARNDWGAVCDLAHELVPSLSLFSPAVAEPVGALGVAARRDERQRGVMLAARAQPLLERLRDEVRAVVEAGGAVPRRR